MRLEIQSMLYTYVIVGRLVYIIIVIVIIIIIISIIIVVLVVVVLGVQVLVKDKVIRSWVCLYQNIEMNFP